MVCKIAVIHSEHGLHVRPAAQLVKMIKQMNSSVAFTYKDKTVPAISLFKVQSLALTQGASFNVCVDGGDEKTNLEQILNFIENME